MSARAAVVLRLDTPIDESRSYRLEVQTACDRHAYRHRPRTVIAGQVAQDAEIEDGSRRPLPAKSGPGFRDRGMAVRGRAIDDDFRREQQRLESDRTIDRNARLPVWILRAYSGREERRARSSPERMTRIDM